MCPNILSYYVLVHDVSSEKDERYPLDWWITCALIMTFRAREAFTSVCSRYGLQFCHLLRINSSNDAGPMPDPWARIIEQRYRGFNRGLEMARRVLIEKAKASQENSEDGNRTIEERVTRIGKIIPNVSAFIIQQSHISLPSGERFLPGQQNFDRNSSLFTTSTTLQIHTDPAASFNGHAPSTTSTQISPTRATSSGSDGYESTEMNQRLSTPDVLSPMKPTIHGQRLDPSDRERLRDFIEEFVRTALIPYAEKQISTQSETLSNRKGLGKSITSMRKWLSATTGTSYNQATSFGNMASNSGSNIAYATLYQ